MKIYVVGYEVRPEYKEALEAGLPVSEEDASDIFYNVRPLWTFPSKEEAEADLRLLLPMRPHKGNHYCQLELDHLEDGQFAVCCINHPESLAERRKQ